MFGLVYLLYKKYPLLGVPLGVPLGGTIGGKFEHLKVYLHLSARPFPPPENEINPACIRRFLAARKLLGDTPTLIDVRASECVKLSGQPNRFACSTR